MTKAANTVYCDGVLMTSLSERWVHNDSFHSNLPCKPKTKAHSNASSKRIL